MCSGAVVHRIGNDDGNRSHPFPGSRERGDCCRDWLLCNERFGSARWQRWRSAGSTESSCDSPSVSGCQVGTTEQPPSLRCSSVLSSQAAVRYSTPTSSESSLLHRSGQQSEPSLRRRSPSDIVVRFSCIPTDRYNDTTGAEAIPAEELSVVRRSLFTLELAGPPLRHTVSNPTGASSWRRDNSLVARTFKE